MEQEFTEFSEFRKSDKSLKLELGPVSHMCLVGAMAASWSLAQEIAGLNPFSVMTLNFVIELSEFSENI